ncbi:NinE family protein [uncultured Enterobacter sp.]|uniref:NinE family protein n=1 Tax=uncultured Enterobacter sp. TaxID=238202 RepID=UPI00259321A0|nr:NinE family protein [uncultured Enterobacter sp.]
MKKQRRSITQIAMDNLIFIPTKRTRNKPKPVPTESDVTTFNYTAHLWDIRWLRDRARK